MSNLRNILPIHNQDQNLAPTSTRESKRSHIHRHGDHHHREHARARKNAMSAWMSNKWRNELVASLAEFAGTFMFLCMSTSTWSSLLKNLTHQRASLILISPTVFAFGGTQVANTAASYSDQATAGQSQNSITQAPNTSVLLYISLIFGFSLMVTVWVFFRVSGGLFNPAVSLRPMQGTRFKGD
jgi:aquaporin related protein